MKNNSPKSDAKAPCRRESAAKSTDNSWRTLHQQFVAYGRNAKEWTRKCQLLLPQIEKQQIWRKKRFKDIYEYAAKLAGMSHNQVNDALRILNKAENLPALKEVISIKGLSAVRPVIAIATEENQAFLAEKAMNMNKNTLEIFVRHFRSGEIIGLENDKIQPNLQITECPRTSSQSINMQIGQQNRLGFSAVTENQSSNLSKVTLVLQLDPAIADQLQKLKGQGDWNEIISELLKLRQEKLDQEKPKVVEDATRPIPAAIEKYALAITNSTCAFPGCQKAYAILHHTDRFAMYHTHDPDRIVPLCEAHERMAHLGLIENENQPPQFWSLRAQPDYDDPKYEIDQIVEKFRQPKK